MKLRELRLKNNLKQDEFAKIFNIKRATYSNYENENTQPPLEILIKIANYFHVNIIDKGLLNNVEIDIIDKLRFLDRDNQIRLQAYTNALYDNQQQEIETIKRIKGDK